MTALRRLALTLLVLCSPPAHARPTRVIGVALLTLQHEFFRELRAGIEQQAKEHGYEVVVVAGEFDAARQARQLDALIDRRVDAIIVAPCDSVEIGASIERANQAGIPVFTTDIASTSSVGRVVAHVASDNHLGGRRAGELMVKALGGRGDIVLVTHPGITSVIDRVNGFKEVVATASGIRILAEVPAWGQRARATAVVEELLARLPSVRGVFAINDESALGAIAAVTAAGRARSVVIVGYDATPEAREAIRRGVLHGDVVQYPRRIGALSVGAVRDHFAGRKVPAYIPVDTGVFTAEDARKE